MVNKTDVDTPRDGGALRVAAVVAAFRARAGVHLDFVAASGTSRPDVTVGWRDRLAAVKVLARFVRWGSLSCLRWYSFGAAVAFAAAARNADVAVVEHSQLLPYAEGLDIPVHVDLHNVEAELLANYAGSAADLPRRLLARYESWRVGVLEAHGVARVASTSVVSAHDTQVLNDLIARRGGRPVQPVVASNGVADEGFTVPVQEPAQQAVFVANLGWRPNIDAAVWLGEQVWPLVREQLPSAELLLVGRAPSEQVLALADDSVSVHGDVDSVLPFLQHAAVATAPLLAAGGTRLKIIEALSTATPVVATSLGALGLEQLESDFLVIRDDPESFAAALVDHLKSPGKIVAARTAAEQFRWDKVLAGLVDTVMAEAGR